MRKLKNTSLLMVRLWMRANEAAALWRLASRLQLADVRAFADNDTQAQEMVTALATLARTYSRVGIAHFYFEQKSGMASQRHDDRPPR